MGTRQGDGGGAARRPTLNDVAHRAGVSRATASRVLAGSGTVDGAMARAVHAAAAALGYRTNLAARSLRRGRTGAVALVTSAGDPHDVAVPFTAGPLRGATGVLRDADVMPVLLLEDGTRLDRLAAHLRDGHVDGVVVVLLHELRHVMGALAGLDLPVVCVGRPDGPGAEGAWWVDADNYTGARLAVRALLEAGRTRTVHVAGPEGMHAADARVRGYLDEHAAWGVPPGPVARGRFVVSGGAEAAARLLVRRPDLDGVVAASDLMALGAHRVLQAAGRRVPQDVSLVGFDDTVVAATADPPLTSVHLPLEEMGRRAAEAVLAALDGAAGPVHEVLATRLVRRESV